MKQAAAQTLGPMAGWTLIELSLVMALIAILTSLGYPGFKSVILRVHRGDALATLTNVQLQQQRHRSNQPRFATLAELGINTTSPGGRYRLHEQLPTASGFFVMASALGTQAADLPCSHLLLQVVGADTRFASGPDADVANADSDNQRCWGK